MDSFPDNDDLFTGFPPVTTAQWEEKIRNDLKGADYEKKLLWSTGEGFSVKPYYRAEDLNNLAYLDSLPGEAPYVRGNGVSDQPWQICQELPLAGVDETNRLALDSIARGAQAIGFNVTDVTSQKQMESLLKEIDLSLTGIHFIASRSFPLTAELFLAEVNRRGIPADQIRGIINHDPIGYLLRHGEFYVDFNQNLDETEQLLNFSQKQLPGLKVLTVNGQFLQEAGSTLVQELAFSLAWGNEYLSGMAEKGFSVDQLAPKILFSFAVGSNYFLEIAKLRAARVLWSTIVEQYKPSVAGTGRMFIHASTALWNKSIFDPYVNMLRTTTEGMAAALGNADYITLQPFDTSFRDPDEFSLRIARNQQLVLREECYLNKIVDPSAGSYYIENLTDSIATLAWNLFRNIEARGGILACIKQGYVQQEVKKSRAQKEKDIAQRKIVMVGANQYPNLQETMMDKVRKQESILSAAITPYEKLPGFRVSEAFESIRLATEQYVSAGNKRPSVFLFTFGNIAMLRARAGFTTNFFGCAGYEIIDNPGFASVEEGVDAVVKSDAEVVVVCSSDDEYPEVVPDIAGRLKTLRRELILVVAGYPKDSLEILKSSGVDEFIHVRCNLLETLNKFQQKLIKWKPKI